MQKINWGVLGTADIAKGCTIPGMQQADNAVLYAIAGRSLEKALQFKEQFGFEKAYALQTDMMFPTDIMNWISTVSLMAGHSTALIC